MTLVLKAAHPTDELESQSFGPELQSRQSLLSLAPLLVLAMILLANRWQKTDPDLWGHIRFGQMMLSSGHIVSHDPYSYSAFGSPWRDHEYLSEITMAAIYNAAGIVGLKAWKFACIAATIVFLVMALAETAASCLVQLNILATTVVVVAPYIQFRPQLHTYALFALILALLAEDNYRGSARLWPMIPVMALWSNLHGGFIMGLATLLAYAGAVAALDFWNGRGHRRARKLEAIAVAGCAATLLPPHGITSWRAVLTAVSSPMTYKYLADWQPLNVAMQAQWQSNHYSIASYVLLLGLWAILIVSVWLRPHEGDFPLVFVALLMSIAALKAERNAPLSAIACAIPAARHLRPLLSHGMQSHVDPILPNWVQGLLAGSVMLLTSKGFFSARLPTDMPYPSAAINYMNEHQLHGNVLTYFCWGEYVIWYLAPQSKVFFDSRCDGVYPLRIINDYLRFYWCLPGADTVLKTYPHDFILVRTADEPSDKMLRTSGWKLIYSDAESALFARSDSRAARLAGIPVMGTAPTNQHFP